MALALQLSLYIVVLVFIMVCIGPLLVGSTCCGGFVTTWLLLFIFGVLMGVCWGGRLRVVGGLCGKFCWACARASLIIPGATLDCFLNSWRIRFVGYMGSGFG